MSNGAKEKNKYLSDAEKFVFYQYFKLYIFFAYSKRLLSGKISLAQFVFFMRRLLLLYDRMKINKVVKTRGVYKTHIYLPAFPTRAFFIALDKFLARGGDLLGLYPTSVLLSTTKACNHRCPHCYQRLDESQPMPLDKLREIGRQIQNLNISFINIEGGEPLADFARLAVLLEAIDPERSEMWVNTNGSLLTREMAERMKNLGVFGVMVSLHHWDRETYDSFAGVEGSYDAAINALKLSAETGLSTAINCTGTRDLIDSGGFEKIMQIAKDAGCAYVQLIHEKPAGAWLGRPGTLDREYIKKLCDYHVAYSGGSKYEKYPAISSQAFESQPENYGCTAGGVERFYINAAGEVQPCEFLHVSFGNVVNEPFVEIYKRMRKAFEVPKTAWLCCTENHRIGEEMRRTGGKTTPLSKELSAELIKSFDFGKKTSLYEKMKLYGDQNSEHR